MFSTLFKVFFQQKQVKIISKLSENNEELATVIQF